VRFLGFDRLDNDLDATSRHTQLLVEVWLDDTLDDDRGVAHGSLRVVSAVAGFEIGLSRPYPVLFIIPKNLHSG
jgi:hypothetical protein